LEIIKSILREIVFQFYLENKKSINKNK